MIGNSREGAAAKKRRQLERKLNSMKTDMEKLNMKLLEAKDEVKSREARCYELQTLVTMRENKIKVPPWGQTEVNRKLTGSKFKDQESEVERYKTVAVDMEEEKNRERKERIDTIFMYESRIKGTVIYYSGYYGPSSTDDPDLGCPYFPVYDFYRRRSFLRSIAGKSFYWLFKWDSDISKTNYLFLTIF